MAVSSREITGLEEFNSQIAELLNTTNELLESDPRSIEKTLISLTRELSAKLSEFNSSIRDILSDEANEVLETAFRMATAATPEDKWQHLRATPSSTAKTPAEKLRSAKQKISLSSLSDIEKAQLYACLNTQILSTISACETIGDIHMASRTISHASNADLNKLFLMILDSKILELARAQKLKLEKTPPIQGMFSVGHGSRLSVNDPLTIFVDLFSVSRKEALAAALSAQANNGVNIVSKRFTANIDTLRQNLLEQLQISDPKIIRALDGYTLEELMRTVGYILEQRQADPEISDKAIQHRANASTQLIDSHPLDRSTSQILNVLIGRETTLPF